MTKIDIISGFLGAGKTTLIKKLIQEAFEGEKLMLIENEFGEIGIDGGFLNNSGVEITEMNSGCICCSLVGDFGTALKDALSKYSPERIIIEPSGVGKLSDVIKAVENIQHEVDIKLNSFVAVVDAIKCKMYMDNFGEFFNNQIESANTIILSRSQKLSQEKLELCVSQIRELNSKATIITTNWEEIHGKQILLAMEKKIHLKKSFYLKKKNIMTMMMSTVATITNITTMIMNVLVDTITIMNMIITIKSAVTMNVAVDMITTMNNMIMMKNAVAMITSITTMTMNALVDTIMNKNIIMQMKYLQAGV